MPMWMVGDLDEQAWCRRTHGGFPLIRPHVAAHLLRLIGISLARVCTTAPEAIWSSFGVKSIHANMLRGLSQDVVDVKIILFHPAFYVVHVPSANTPFFFFQYIKSPRDHGN